MTCNMFFQHLK